MTEFIERMSLDDLDFSDDSASKEPKPRASSGQLLGAALLGAITTVALGTVAAVSCYYIYSSLDSDFKARLHDKLFGFADDISGD